MIFVSHDRTFLRGLSNRVLELGGESGTDSHPHAYPGRTSSTSNGRAMKHQESMRKGSCRAERRAAKAVPAAPKPEAKAGHSVTTASSGSRKARRTTAGRRRRPRSRRTCRGPAGRLGAAARDGHRVRRAAHLRLAQLDHVRAKVLLLLRASEEELPRSLRVSWTDGEGRRRCGASIALPRPRSSISSAWFTATRWNRPSPTGFGKRTSCLRRRPAPKPSQRPAAPKPKPKQPAAPKPRARRSLPRRSRGRRRAAPS